MFVSNTKPPNNGLFSQSEDSVEALELKIRDLVVEKFLVIVSEHEKSETTYKSNPQVLQKGFWYGNTYYKALKESKAFDVLKSVIECGFFYDGLPPDGFTEIKDPTYLNGIRILSYTLKEGVNPTKALQSTRESLCFIDCQTALEIAYYEVLLELLGEEAFNQYFCFEGEHPLSLDPDIFSTPLKDFMLTIPLSEGEWRQGDQRYFANHPLYCLCHIYGESQGYHTLCIQTSPEVRVTALGLSPKGHLEDELFDICVDEFNRTPLGLNSIVTNELGLKILYAILENGYKNGIEEGRAKELTKEELCCLHKSNPERAGFHPNILRLNATRIHQLIHGKNI